MVANSRIMGAALGSIMPTIITTHIRNMRAKPGAPQGNPCIASAITADIFSMSAMAVRKSHARAITLNR
jgi:hypothetical protein